MSWLYTVRLILSICYELSIALASFPLVLLSSWSSSGILSQRRSTNKREKVKHGAIHDREVEKIAAQVKQAYEQRKLVVLKRKPGQGHSARSSAYKKGHHGVNVASLDSILAIDKINKTASVQAGVTFESLCKATLAYGLLPLVVPEFKSITIGGAIQGIGIESSSWTNGAFDETVLEATLVLGDGSVVSSDSVPELWTHVPGSNGSLALVVAATIRLEDAADAIRIRYTVYKELQDFLHATKNMSSELDSSWNWKGSERLVDAMYIKNIGIVAMFAGCVDTMPVSNVHEAQYNETTFSPFFFQHVEAIARSKLRPTGIEKNSDTQYVETMPTLQYLFRYDRGGFWGIMALGHMLPPLRYILERPLLTGILNHFLTTATLYKVAMLLKDIDRETAAMLQDVDIPCSKANVVFDWAILHNIEYMWLCPVRNGSGSMFSVSGAHEQVLNIGLYGVVDGLPYANRQLQRLVAQCGGKTALYAHIYVEVDEFWTWYDLKVYERLRSNYHGGAFLDLFKKVGGISRQVA